MSQKKKQWKKIRKSFRKDLRVRMSKNPALAMLAVETYAAYQHRKHIYKIWELLGHHHEEAWSDYNKNLSGHHLMGDSRIFKSLYFADYELYKKYIRQLPERPAMGDALGVAYSCLANKTNKGEKK